MRLQILTLSVLICVWTAGEASVLNNGTSAYFYVVGVTRLGCFFSTSEGKETVERRCSDTETSPLNCYELCESKGSIYFLLYNGGCCFCSNRYEENYPLEYAESSCRTACTGDASSTCGGPHKAEVYKTGFWRVMKLTFNDCNQSSTLESYTCDKAYDGIFWQKVSEGGCFLTNQQSGNWWRAQFIEYVHLRRIRMYNRMDECCSNRMNNFVISLDDVPWYEHSEETASGPSIRNIRMDGYGLHLTIKSLREYLSLCEVEAFGEYTQGSIRYMKMDGCYMMADKDAASLCRPAIDGELYTCTSLENANSTFMTWIPSRGRSFSSVDENFIKIRIFNRQDVKYNLPHDAPIPAPIPFLRSDFTVSVGGRECASYRSSQSDVAVTLDCRMTGNLITVRTNGPPLTLCEIQVYYKRKWWDEPIGL